MFLYTSLFGILDFCRRDCLCYILRSLRYFCSDYTILWTTNIRIKYEFVCRVVHGTTIIILLPHHLIFLYFHSTLHIRMSSWKKKNSSVFCCFLCSLFLLFFLIKHLFSYLLTFTFFSFIFFFSWTLPVVTIEVVNQNNDF